MKKRILGLIILIGSVFNVLYAQNAIVGIWQLLREVESSNGDYYFRLVPNYKIIKEDGTFVQVYQSNDRTYKLSHSGTYTVKGYVYTEHIKECIFDPKWIDRTNAIRYRFIDENLLHLNFSVSSTTVKKSEYLKRVEDVDPDLLYFINHH